MGGGEKKEDCFNLKGPLPLFLWGKGGGGCYGRWLNGYVGGKQGSRMQCCCCGNTHSGRPKGM